MSNIVHFKGNIFDTTAAAIGHGVNLQSNMAGGIAAQIAQKYPEVFEFYKEICATGEFTLGQTLPAITNDGGWILNMATQVLPGADARIEAIEPSLREALDFMSDAALERLALPQIGSGIGGLEWHHVLAIIERVAADYPEVIIELWTYEKRK